MFVSKFSRSELYFRLNLCLPYSVIFYTYLCNTVEYCSFWYIYIYPPWGLRPQKIKTFLFCSLYAPSVVKLWIYKFIQSAKFFLDQCKIRPDFCCKSWWNIAYLVIRSVEIFRMHINLCRTVYGEDNCIFFK